MVDEIIGGLEIELKREGDVKGAEGEAEGRREEG